MKKLILIFLIVYALFGLTNSMLFSTPNNTNDFVFHYYRANGDTTNPEFTEYYSVEETASYPSFYHVLMMPFASSKLLFYLVMVFLLCGVMPYLLYKLAGEFSVWVYFALSFPHMILFNSTFASFMIMLYVILYFFFERKTWAFILFMFLASLTHKSGLIVFAVILIAEFIEKLYLRYEWKKYWKLPTINLGAGFLMGDRIASVTKLISVFINHINIYFVYLALKNKNVFLWFLVVVGFVGAITYDFRTLMVSQLAICLLIPSVIEKTENKKYFYIICVLLMILNFLSFGIETERFLLFN